MSIINVSNRLPVTVGEQITCSSGGLVSALEGVTQNGRQLRWVGWPGASFPDAKREEEVRKTLEKEFGFTPVFLTGEEIAGFYDGFSNSSVWPLLHYMPARFRYQANWWDSYQAVNRRFADTVLELARDGDLVWVHDYQLTLLPEMLRDAMPSLKIGFFLHTPFPSYEVFRCHPRRRELLAGILGADQAGFHTYNYLRHFRSAVMRLLPFETDMLMVRQSGHGTSLGAYPIGINISKFDEQMRQPEYFEHLQALEKTYEGRRVVLSIERLDYTKGILERLDAIDQFLSDAPAGTNVTFVMISIPSREEVQEYKLLLEDVEARVGKLNGKHATLHNTPVRFIHGSVPFPELCALYALADVAVVTPLIDGMNLVAKEYVACHAERPGVLILSEFAGAAEELSSAIVVNPYDVEALAASLREALDMGEAEKRGRMKDMRERVATFTAEAWARSFIDDLQRLSQPAEASDHIDALRIRIVTGLSVPAPSALFLDYDGTIREFELDPGTARPHPPVRQLLDALAARRGTDVTIISGRSSAQLEEWLGHYPFAFVAEHGAEVRARGSTHWEQTDRNISYEWKNELGRVLAGYARSTPGSFVEVKRTSLVWHYRRTDPELGGLKATQLVEELTSLIGNQPLVVRHGRRIVEITPAGVNKGAAVARLIADTSYAMVLAAGDDLTDESMFALAPEHFVSIHVGGGETAAQFRVPTPAALRKVLMSALATSPLGPATAPGDRRPVSSSG